MVERDPGRPIRKRPELTQFEKLHAPDRLARGLGALEQRTPMPQPDNHVLPKPGVLARRLRG